MNRLLVITTLITAIAWTGLIIWYTLRAKWWKTPIGRNTMGVSVVITLIMYRTLVLLSTPPFRHFNFWQIFWGIVFYGCLTYLGVRRIVFVEQAQRWHDPDDRPK